MSHAPGRESDSATYSHPMACFPLFNCNSPSFHILDLCSRFLFLLLTFPFSVSFSFSPFALVCFPSWHHSFILSSHLSSHEPYVLFFPSCLLIHSILHLLSLFISIHVFRKGFTPCFLSNLTTVSCFLFVPFIFIFFLFLVIIHLFCFLFNVLFPFILCYSLPFLLTVLFPCSFALSLPRYRHWRRSRLRGIETSPSESDSAPANHRPK